MLLTLAGVFVLIIAVVIAFTTARSRIMAHVSQEIIYDIRKDLFAHLQKLPFSYYDSRPAGKILVRVINYVNSVSDILSNGIINAILEIINIVFIIGFMYATNAVLATIIVAGLPVFIAIIFYLKPRQRPRLAKPVQQELQLQRVPGREHRRGEGLATLRAPGREHGDHAPAGRRLP